CFPVMCCGTVRLGRWSGKSEWTSLCWEILDVASSFSVWLCNSSTTNSVLSDAKLDPPNACELEHQYLFPHYSMLVTSFQVWIGQSRSSSCHGTFDVVKRDHPHFVHEVLFHILNTIVTLNAIPYGLSAAASIRISNELGAGQPHGARISVIATMLLTATSAIIISTTLLASRKVFGYTFSNEKEVVDSFSNMAPFVCLSLIIDSIQGRLSGVLRGCGRLHTGAYVNIAAFYLFGIPIAVTLSFWLDFRGKGLWIGILSGAALQAVMLSAAKARRRLLEVEPSLEGGLTWRNHEAIIV
ncbi:UNVERIFIED_CONTAM: Protein DETOXIFICATION 12, partial [Sesamum indicum]